MAEVDDFCCYCDFFLEDADRQESCSMIVGVVRSIIRQQVPAFRLEAPESETDAAVMCRGTNASQLGLNNIGCPGRELMVEDTSIQYFDSLIASCNVFA